MAQICVIVPVYNVEKYLRRCVDSVLRQTYADFRLLLVDDGSPDNCGSICDSYARQDERIHVIHQKNAGLSAARNSALDWMYANSSCQWITFLDSDDWLHPEFLQRMLAAAQENQTLVSICGYEETTGDDPVIAPEMLAVQCWEPGEFYREKSTNATIACGKLYHRQCFETLRYPLGKIHEDEFITYQTLFMSQKVAVIPAALYAYYINPVGITKKPWTVKRLDAWQAYEEQIAFFHRRGDKVMHECRYRHYIENAYAQLCTAQTAPNAVQLKKEIRYIKKQMRNIFRRAGKFGYVKFWIDFDMLYACAPVGTKLYRLWLEIKK